VKRPKLTAADRFLWTRLSRFWTGWQIALGRFGGGLPWSSVTAHPTAEWAAQQLHETFPWETAPRHLLRDRSRILGADFVTQVKAMGIKQVLSRKNDNSQFIKQIGVCENHGRPFGASD
jgi:hypothetical protein